MTTSQPRPSGSVGRRYWILVVIGVILGMSLLVSFDFTSGQFRPEVWSTFISGVQVSTLIVVVVFLLLWVRSHEQ